MIDTTLFYCFYKLMDKSVFFLIHHTSTGAQYLVATTTPTWLGSKSVMAEPLSLSLSVTGRKPEAAKNPNPAQTARLHSVHR